MKAARLHAYHEALKLDCGRRAQGRRAVRRDRADRRRRPVPHRPAHPGGPVGREVRRRRCPTRPATRTPAGCTRSAPASPTSRSATPSSSIPTSPAGCACPAAWATTCTASTARSPGSTATGASPTCSRPRRARWSSSTRALEPKDIAALADAGLTAIHAVKKAIPVLGAGTRVVVIGAGGLGHIGIQCLKAYTPAEIIVIDPVREGAGAGRRDGRRPDGEGRRQAGRHGQGDDRRLRRRGDHRLRGREGRDRGRHRDGPRRRLLLRDRLRREHQHPDDRRDQPRDLLHRQPRRAPTPTCRS